MAQTSLLAKKTKTEILDEYVKLQDQIEYLKAGAKFIAEPAQTETVSRAKAMSPEAITDAFAKLRTAIMANFSDLSNLLYHGLQREHDGILADLQKFDELQRAIEISQKTLENRHHITIAAETLKQLVDEYETKQKKLQDEFNQQTRELADATAARRREWAREQEEYGYAIKTARAREQAALDEDRMREKKALLERETAAKAAEAELTELRKQAGTMPDRIAEQITAREKELRKDIEAEFGSKTELLRREWESEKKLLQLRLETAEDEMKRRDQDLGVMRKEAEAAQKKAQELAVKVIESGARPQQTAADANAPKNN